MQVIETEVLYRPESAEVRYLPEGPCQLNDGRISFVGIQHGADSSVGSINLLLPIGGNCMTYELPGRPGFAFPTDQPGLFVAGVERALGMFSMGDRNWKPFEEGIDSSVEGTIINDGIIVDDNLVFGCKDLTFSTKKAGLYLWRRSDRSLIQLRNDQICSNGKGVVRDESGQLSLIDIDSPTKQITRSKLDIEAGTLGDPQVIVDLTGEEVFPDGMILTPDEASLIVALYDPGDPEAGVARQYCINTGELQRVWTCPGSPRVTCPQLIGHLGRVRLLLTTAVEGMPPEQLERHANAGCLFAGNTSFSTTGDQPVFSSL
jgi:sugar lactone lactonase YvrE